MAFKMAAGRYPTGVIVVTAQADGVDHAMTANSFTSVSLDPLLVLICVQHGTRFHQVITRTEQWGISVLAEDAAEQAKHFARRGRDLASEFAGVAVRRSDSGVLLLTDSLMTMQCSTHQVIRAGDHDVVIGRVDDFAASPEGRPLVYWARTFRTVGDEVG